jgi:hypothetical protein
MTHYDEPLYMEEDESVHNLLNYKQSFFWYNNTAQLFPNFTFSNETLPVNSSEEYCLHLWSKNATSDKILPETYKNLSFPLCKKASNNSKQLGNPNDPTHGISFLAWKETELALWCTNLTCYRHCLIYGGTYHEGKCYKHEVLRRICIKTDFKDIKTGNMTLIYSQGCF